MRNNGNPILPPNPNADQIEANSASAPSKKCNKKRFEIHTEIVSSLLKHEALTEGEIGDECGYKDKGMDKYQNVHRQIKKLESTWNYIEHIENPRPGYRILRNPETICHIYDDKKFELIRREFQTSPWLTDLIIERNLPEYREEKEFVEDVKKMLKTSPLMFNWYLRGTLPSHHTATLGEILGPSLPKVKVTGINNDLLEWVTRKGIVYDFFLTCLLLECQNDIEEDTLPKEACLVRNEMNQKSSDLKLAAINYILSFTMMQNLARCVDAIQNNQGEVPPFFGEIVKDYNTMSERIKPDKTNRESLKTEAADMAELYNKTCEFLRSTSIIDPNSGKVAEMGSVFLNYAQKNVMKKSDNGEEKKG